MAEDRTIADPIERAKEIEASFRISAGIYLLGSLEKGGVTVYNQQVRAHNLVWALSELVDVGGTAPKKVAVVGGGIAGLTIAACLTVLFDQAQITVFEKRWDVCPLQLGSDTRWLHPRIAEWPDEGSRAPSAGLPVLNWTEGRASDVARQVIRRFSKYADFYSDRLRIYIGVSHLKIHAKNRVIDWMGSSTDNVGSFLRVATGEGASHGYDTIILAPGFGLEREHKVFAPISYWRNEQNGQPVLNGTRQAYVVSGYGDGALVDLFRLTIERFRQDSILYELFDKDIDDFELNLRALYKKRGISRGDNLFDLFSELGGQLETAVHKLAGRIRKDTTVILHAAGTGGNKSLRKLFGPYSSFLNRFLLFLLYRCGAFSLSFDELTATVKDFGVPTQNVLCRHGAAAKEHVIQLFTDPDSVEGALKNLEQESVQSARRLWIPGYFPPPKRTGA